MQTKKKKENLRFMPSGFDVSSVASSFEVSVYITNDPTGLRARSADCPTRQVGPGSSDFLLWKLVQPQAI